MLVARQKSVDDPLQPVSLVRSSLTQVVRVLPLNLRKSMRMAPKHADKITRRIERYIAEGKTKKAEDLARLCSHSYDVKLVALYEANKRLPKGCRSKKVELHRIAGEMDLRQTQGSATYRAEPKPKGGFRPVINFTVEARGAQLVLKRATQPFLYFRLDQFAISNGGRPAASHRVVELTAQGYVWFKEGDVKQCYASITPDGVKKLLGGNLWKMTEANALSKNVQASLRKTKAKLTTIDTSNLSKEVRTGIPQGSKLSPSIAEAVVAYVLDQATKKPDWPDVKLIGYVDNIGILGRNEADVECAADILVGAFKRSQFGPLKLLCKDVRSIRQGFEFLGTRFISRRRRIRAELSPIAMTKCLKWLSAALEDGKIPAQQIKQRLKSRSAAMALRQEGRPLTRATQWANAVWHYAAEQKLRGRNLREQAAYHLRVLNNSSLVYAPG